MWWLIVTILLRSGDIKDFQMLGQDGKPAYLLAPQIRETFRYKLGRQYADFLATPQRNDQGNIIDWYIPFASDKADGSYDIIPWTAATAEEQAHALDQLQQFEQQVIELGKQMSANPALAGDQLLFSRLIYNPQPASDDPRKNLVAIRFPGPEYVYIVNGIPVITFWGFISQTTQVNGSPFYCLDIAKKSVAVPPVLPAAAALNSPPWWKRWWLWLLALLLLLGLLFLLRGCFFKEAPIIATLPTDPLQKSATEPDRLASVPDDGRRLVNGQWVDRFGKPIELVPGSVAGARGDARGGEGELTEPTNAENSSGLDPEEDPANDPNQAAHDKSGDEAANPKDEVADPKDDAAAPTDPTKPTTDEPAGDKQAPDDHLADNRANNKLALPEQSLQKGDTTFLNGTWSAGSGMQDKATGKPLSLNYDFKNGQGNVTIKRGDGVSCSGSVDTRASSQGLNIGSGGEATCSDNSRYQLPQIECTPGAGGIADCKGRYENGTTFPISMKKSE